MARRAFRLLERLDGNAAMKTLARRRLLGSTGSTLLAVLAGWGSTHAPAQRAPSADGRGATQPLTLFTFGDSILDCGHYNAHGVHPAQLIVRNDDVLFPEFRGHDLTTRDGEVQLVHRAVDGSTVAGLASQRRDLPSAGRAAALLTVGGNDLIRGLASDTGPGVQRFEAALREFVESLPMRPVLIGNVYDPTFGDDTRNFLGVDPRTARANHRRVNAVLADVAARHGRLIDLHAHFMTGNSDWYVRTIEPSLIGASEIRRAFLAAL
jgi:acyl-CoA thioesterase-1